MWQSLNPDTWDREPGENGIVWNCNLHIINITLVDVGLHILRKRRLWWPFDTYDLHNQNIWPLAKHNALALHLSSKFVWRSIFIKIQVMCILRVCGHRSLCTVVHEPYTLWCSVFLQTVECHAALMLRREEKHAASVQMVNGAVSCKHAVQVR